MCRPSRRAATVLLLALALVAGSAAAQAPPPVPAPGNAKTAVPTAAKPPATAPALPAPPGSAAPGGTPPSAAPAGVAAQAAGPQGLLVPGSEFRYDPTGRRDPFRSLLQLEKKQRDITQLPPIQQFDVEAAKVIGIVVDPARGAQAMIRAPSGLTFVVRVGTVMGKNEGEVVEITMKGIRILEKFLDFMNRETRKETFLKSHPAADK